jgi:hypothetical protein
MVRLKVVSAAVIAGIVLHVTTGCSTIATYDQLAYEKVTSCKAEVLNLMSKATTPYADNKDEIEQVSLDVAKAYEYDCSRPLNRITISMWDLIRDPNRDTSAGFFRIWKQKSVLHQAFIDQKKIQVGQAFDQISQLEAGKIK